MRAIEITAPGKPDVLRETERPTPAFGAGEALIRVAASGINRPDVLQRKGLYPVPPGASDIPGLEVAGTIVDGDRDALAAAGFAIGARVCALVAGGGYAELLRRAGRPVPAEPGQAERRRGGEPAGDVLHRLVERLRPRPPAAGRDAARPRRLERHRRHRDPDGQGLGRDGARRPSARPRRRRRAARSAPITRSTTRRQDFVAEVLRLTDGKGADVVLDMVAGEYIGRDVKCLAEDGRIVIIAVQGGIAVDRRRQPGAAPAPRRSPARRCGRGRSPSRRRSPRRCARPRGRGSSPASSSR